MISSLFSISICLIPTCLLLLFTEFSTSRSAYSTDTHIYIFQSTFLISDSSCCFNQKSLWSLSEKFYVTVRSTSWSETSGSLNKVCTGVINDFSNVPDFIFCEITCLNNYLKDSAAASLLNLFNLIANLFILSTL